MKRTHLFLLLPFAAVLAYGCGSGGSSFNTARVRFFHALPNAASISVSVDNQTEIDLLSYGGESREFSVDEGTRRLRVDVNGLLASVIDQNQSFNSEQSYRIYVVGPLSDAQLLVRRDLADDGPAEDEFRIRFAHVSAQKDTYDVYIIEPDTSLSAAIPVTESLTYKTISKYFNIPQGAVQIILTQRGSKTIVLDSGPIGISERKNYTYNIIDQPQGGNPLLGVLTSDD